MRSHNLFYKSLPHNEASKMSISSIANREDNSEKNSSSSNQSGKSCIVNTKVGRRKRLAKTRLAKAAWSRNTDARSHPPIESRLSLPESYSSRNFEINHHRRSHSLCIFYREFTNINLSDELCLARNPIEVGR